MPNANEETDSARWLVLQELYGAPYFYLVESGAKRFSLDDLPDDNGCNGHWSAWRLDENDAPVALCKFSYEFTGITVCYPDEVYVPRAPDKGDARIVREGLAEIAKAECREKSNAEG